MMYPILTAACTLTLGGVYLSADKTNVYTGHDSAETCQSRAAPCFAYTLAAYHNPPTAPEKDQAAAQSSVIVVESEDEEFTIADARDRWHEILEEARATPPQPVKKNLVRPNWPTRERHAGGRGGSARSSYGGGTFFQQARFNRARSEFNRTARGRYIRGDRNTRFSRSRIGRATSRNRSMFTRSRARGGR